MLRHSINKNKTAATTSTMAIPFPPSLSLQIKMKLVSVRTEFHICFNKKEILVEYYDILILILQPLLG